MVNWAPLLQTAVSDLEVEYSEEEGKLYFFKYMVDGSEGKSARTPWFQHGDISMLTFSSTI